MIRTLEVSHRTQIFAKQIELIYKSQSPQPHSESRVPGNLKPLAPNSPVVFGHAPMAFMLGFCFYLIFCCCFVLFFLRQSAYVVPARLEPTL